MDSERAWTVNRVHDVVIGLRASMDTQSERKIREIARDIVRAHIGPQLPLGVEMANGLYIVPVHARGGGYRDIVVRLIPGMYDEEAQEIAERQIREQWRG